MNGAGRIRYAVVLVLVVMAGLSGCGDEGAVGAEVSTAVLYPEFTHGAMNWEPEKRTYKEELSPRILARGLSKVTGLNFVARAGQMDDGTLTIDWDLDSTLFAGEEERDRQAEPLFLDGNSLRWFMLDSMAHTVQANLGITSVYYTMDGGAPLVLEGLYPPVDFWNMPYMGSAFYFDQEELTGVPGEPN